MAEKKRYQTVILGLSEARKPLHQRLVALAEQLGCRVSDLMWSASETLLQNPPTVAPVGASQAAGSAPGFWVTVEVNDKGKATGLGILEVESRAQAKGRTFFRISRNEDGTIDAKARARALRQAQRAAQEDAALIGLKPESITVDVFEE